jgi:long-chain acyl-CoA synthetase
MNFLEAILNNLAEAPSKPILQEVWGGQLVSTSSEVLLENIARARRQLTQAGLRRGDRCALLAPNSSRWVAVDLAIMAEGAIVVPLYSRQSPDELVSMMKDCCPRLICCSDLPLSESVVSRWPNAPSVLLFDQVLGESSARPPKGIPAVHTRRVSLHSDPAVSRPAALQDDTPITIIYTSGTSGEAKGAVLNVGNITFMLQRTRQRLEELMLNAPKEGDDRVFHYLPFCFAGSWILLLTCLIRNNCLMMSTDLGKLVEEMKTANPHYMLNVPALLERLRNGVNSRLQQKGGLPLVLFERGQSAWWRLQRGQRKLFDNWWLALARTLLFSRIRQQLGPNLQALICGSAPLSEETQLFFHMLGILVLQVYGLTETTAICTMDRVEDVVPGWVGPAIPGIEMKLGNNEEILVRGPNVFPGYWNRFQATAEVIKNGWLHTGDQGQADERGNWKIIGRLKNLIITSGGHNISPEPLEQMLLKTLPEADHVMIVGNGRKFLSAIIAGKVSADRIETALKAANQSLPHYKQVRKFYLSLEPFTPENGLLTTYRKLKRPAIEARYREQIEQLYRE